VNEKIPSILAAFETFDGTYKRDEVDAALALQDEITPYLIDVLKSVLADPVAYLDKPDPFGHVYAIELLGHFREVRAHDVIVDLTSLPDEMPYDLFGDTITEDLPAILLATCGGSIVRIKELLLNREADEYCRSAAAHALVYATVEGVVPRQEILDLFGSLFTGNEASSDSGFWDLLAGSAYDLCPGELMPVIEKAFADGLITGDVVGLESFARVLQRGRDRARKETKDEIKRHMPDDFHDRMSWWACFRPAPKAPRPPVSRGKKRSTRTDVPAGRTLLSQTVRKLGRNDPCWCGSGIKYKRCHWREDRKTR